MTMDREYIEREEVIKILEHYDLSSGSTLGCHSGAIECAISAIEMLPAADVAPVRYGRWVNTHSDSEFAQCSLCKYPVYVAWGQTNYCPNCGAYMMGENNGKCE